jgi:hypothetical protein
MTIRKLDFHLENVADEHLCTLNHATFCFSDHPTCPGSPWITRPIPARRGYSDLSRLVVDHSVLKYFWLVIAILALTVLPAVAQSTADLLQKGIYTQETLGDLDGAIKIYRQIANSASQSRTYAAQAQYRLALCLLKKGDNADAVKAFEKLAQDYPEEKELVAKAREFMPNDTKLLPIPWEENELSELRIKLASGIEVGTMTNSIEPANDNAQNSILSYRTYIAGDPEQWSRVEAERDSMRPISDSYRHVYLGNSRIDYEGRQARVHVEGMDPKIVALEGSFFDNQEWAFLFRRLPLSSTYKKRLPIMSPSGTLLKIELAVSAVEDVTVPAGKFHCYKLEITGLNQTLWIGADGIRPIVKMETGGAVVELVNIRKVDRTTPVNYQDAKVGMAFTASPGWIMKPHEVPEKDEASVFMLDPESKASAWVWARQIKTEKPQVAQQLRANVDWLIEHRGSALKGYRLRPESIQLRRIGENQALSCIFDYLEGEHKMIEYPTCVRNENVNVCFVADIAASDFDELRQRFDPIVETVKLK